MDREKYILHNFHSLSLLSILSISFSLSLYFFLFSIIRYFFLFSSSLFRWWIIVDFLHISFSLFFLSLSLPIYLFLSFFLSFYLCISYIFFVSSQKLSLSFVACFSFFPFSVQLYPFPSTVPLLQFFFSLSLTFLKSIKFCFSLSLSFTSILSSQKIKRETLEEGNRNHKKLKSREGKKIKTYKWTFQTVWPDLANFRHTGRILKRFWPFLCCYTVFGKIVNLLWQIFHTVGRIFIVLSGQIFK